MKAFVTMNYLWYYLSLQAYGFLSVSSEQTDKYSNIDSVANFVTALNVDAPTALNISGILGDYEYGAGYNNLNSLNDQERAALACRVSRAVFKLNYLDRHTALTKYYAAVKSSWSETCWLPAACVVQPESALEVSGAMLIVTFLKSRFAVRSGGHNPNAGFASVDGTGVLIDTAKLNEVTLSEDETLVRVGTGNRFGDVYGSEALTASGKSVVGGRTEAVGVGGYYLGGGIGFFSSTYGISASHVRNFEVVLANATIVNANATSNPDLWWALKGGGANFGVATAFDIETVPDSQVWYEVLLFAPSQTEALLAASVEYAAAAENDPNAGLIFTITPSATVLGLVYGKPIVRPAVFDAFLGNSDGKLTPLASYVDSTISSLVEMHHAFSSLGPATSAKYMILSVAHEWDLPTLKEGYATFLDVSSRVAARFNATMTFGVQPWTRSAVRRGIETGGNPLGLKDISQNWVNSVIQWSDSAYDAEAVEAIETLSASIKAASQKANKSLPFIYMNDANHAQRVLHGYGTDNLARLHKISQIYDPLQVFQRLQFDGFLLSES